MNKTFILILILVVISITWFYFFKNPFLVKIGNILIEVEIADTPEERIRGLSGREFLAENSGLLFVYDQPGFYEIWMKDMKFPIDVIWLDRDLRVIDIAKNVQPDSFPKTFKPSAPAKYILEVNSGFTDLNGIKVGDSLTL